jgi:tetratricopeptide (TPR) repeat protein
LFQGFVQVTALRLMGNPEAERCLPEVKGLTREAGIALLGRAAEVGLLTALGGGYYRIHPALPWFFHRLFEQYYPETCTAATRAFVESLGSLATYYHRQYAEGDRDVVEVLAAEEANLLYARSLARSHEWWDPVTLTMQGLRALYEHNGRVAEWSRLVEEVVPDFVDSATEGPLPGKEEGWSLVTAYKAALARRARRWEEADRSQGLTVDWWRRRVASILAKPPQTWDEQEKNSVRSLAVSLEERAHIQRERISAACLEDYREALALYEQIADTHAAAVCALNLGLVYALLNDVRDLMLAEQWCQRSFDLHPAEDRMDRARCLVQLGNVAHERFLDARRAGRPLEECVGYLSSAEKHSKQALEMFPAGAVQDLATAHGQLGVIYGAAGQIDAALNHYGESIRHWEGIPHRFASGSARYNAALALARAGRFDDARDWAQSARRDFEACDNAEQDVVDTLKLLEEIESGLRATSPPSSAHPPPTH